MEEKYYAGQVFNERPPQEVYEWCDACGFILEEVNSDEFENGQWIISDTEDLDVRLDGTDEAICALYEMILEIQNDRS